MLHRFFPSTRSFTNGFCVLFYLALGLINYRIINFLYRYFNFYGVVNHVAFHFLIEGPCMLLHVVKFRFWISALWECCLVIRCISCDPAFCSMHVSGLLSCSLCQCQDCAVSNCVAQKFFHWPELAKLASSTATCTLWLFYKLFLTG